MGTIRKTGDYELIEGSGAARGLYCIAKHNGFDAGYCQMFLLTNWDLDSEVLERLTSASDIDFVTECETMEFG